MKLLFGIAATALNMFAPREANDADIEALGKLFDSASSAGSSDDTTLSSVNSHDSPPQKEAKRKQQKKRKRKRKRKRDA